MSRLVFHSHAKADLDEIGQKDSKAKAVIAATLEQAKTDDEAFDRLTQDGYGADHVGRFQVSIWKSQQYKHQRNLWRLKIWELEGEGAGYRVIYAFDPDANRILVFGVTPRGIFSYEDSDPLTQRIVKSYDSYFGS